MGLWPDMYMYLQLGLSSVFLSWFVNLYLYLYHWIYLYLHTQTYQFNIHGASVWQVAGALYTLSLPIPPFLSLSLLSISASPSIAIAAKRNTKFAQIFIALFLQRLRQCVCNLGEFICHIPTI